MRYKLMVLLSTAWLMTGGVFACGGGSDDSSTDGGDTPSGSDGDGDIFPGCA